MKSSTHETHPLCPSRIAPACLALGLVLAAPFPHPSHARESISVTRISENSNIRTDRRPIHVGFHAADANKTFVSWMGANSHPIVKALDHTTGAWSEDTVVGHSPFADKHNYPGLIRGADDRLYVFYGCHNSTLKMAVSPGPLSIEGDWDDRFIEEAERASYPAPVITSEGAIYVFYRDTRKSNGHSDDRPYQYVKSIDNGRTWTRRMAIDPYPRSTDNMCEIYNGMVTYQPPTGGQQARIHLAWTLAGEKLGRHGHATYGRNVYYAWLDPENDQFHNVEGKPLGDWIDNDEADEHCLVLDTGIPQRGHLAGLQVSAHYRDNGLPLLHFDNRSAGGICSATWNADAWVFSPIGRDGGDPRGLEKFGPESFRVYRPRGDEVRVFRTTNSGLDWELESSFPVGQRVSRCLLIDQYHPDAKLLITENGDGSLNPAKRDVFIGRVIDGGS